MNYEGRLRIPKKEKKQHNEDIDRFQQVAEVQLATLEPQKKPLPDLFTRSAIYIGSYGIAVPEQKFEIAKEVCTPRMSLCSIRTNPKTVHGYQCQFTSYTIIGYGRFPGSAGGKKKDRERYRKGRLIKETTEKQDLANHGILWV